MEYKSLILFEVEKCLESDLGCCISVISESFRDILIISDNVRGIETI